MDDQSSKDAHWLRRRLATFARTDRTGRWTDNDVGAVARLLAERDEQERLFDAMWAADQRGVERWRAGHPERDLISPDRANLAAWLLERITDLEAGDVRLRADNARLHEALRLALLWLPTEEDMPRRASDEAKAQIRTIRAALAGEGER